MTTALGDRMKAYESASDRALNPARPAACRLDGQGFSKWTRGFEKPFDRRLHDVMVRTCNTLLEYFGEATAAYTQSDEITLLFPAGISRFGARTQKLASVAASRASVAFNTHLSDVFGHALPAGKLGTAYFDARFFEVPTHAELMNNVIWRCRGDCSRNSKGLFARAYFSQTELHGLTADAQIRKVLDRHGVDYHDVVPSWARCGTTVKRAEYMHEGRNPVTGETVSVTRVRLEARVVPWTKFSASAVEELVTAAKWDPLLIT